MLMSHHQNVGQNHNAVEETKIKTVKETRLLVIHLCSRAHTLIFMLIQTKI
jgi:hypothetical protein